MSGSGNIVVGVVGAGAMGAGIAYTAARAGHSVHLYDVRPDAAASAVAGLRRHTDRLVERGRMTADDQSAVLEAIRPSDTLESFRDCGLVIEAVIEDAEAKGALLADLERIVSEDAILATNTSSLSVTALGARLRHPERFAGMHFFNPAIVMPLVEVVSGAQTRPDVADRIFDLALAWGKKPVRCGSTPGFIVNRVARPFYGEALRLLEEQVATPATIDAVVTDGGGFRMGPFALMDLIGHDVNLAVTRSVYESFAYDPRYRPSLIQQGLVEAGFLGRKSGRGFYDYAADAVAPAPEDWPVERGAPSVCASADSSLSALVDRLISAGVPADEDAGPEVLIGGLAVRWTDGRTAARVASEIGRPVALLDWVQDVATCSRLALAVSPGANPRALVATLQTAGVTVNLVADAPGLIVARIFAMLANEGVDAVLRGVAKADDIDLAMCAGANHPLGPIERLRSLGEDRVRVLLDNLDDYYRDGRYRASPSLRGLSPAPKPEDF